MGGILSTGVAATESTRSRGAGAGARLSREARPGYPRRMAEDGRFPMTLDRSNRLLTLVVVGILALVVAVQLVVCRGPAAWIPWLSGALMLATLGPAWALSPRAVAVQGGELRVERRMWRPFAVPMFEIERVEPAPDVTLASAVRLFGVGGFFGIYGLLWIRGVGRVRAFLTRRGPGILVRRRGLLPVLLTPDDAAGASEALRRHGAAVTGDLAVDGKRG